MLKIRSDYEIKIGEHEKMSDVFHEIGLPTNLSEHVNVSIVAITDEPMQRKELERITKVVREELESWGFLDPDIEHDIKSKAIYGEEYSLMIYTS